MAENGNTKRLLTLRRLAAAAPQSRGEKEGERSGRRQGDKRDRFSSPQRPRAQRESRFH